jgi:hypothetical protein
MFGIKILEPFQNYKNVFPEALPDYRPAIKTDWNLRQNKFDFFREYLDVSTERTFDKQYFFPVYLKAYVLDKKGQTSQLLDFVKANKELFVSKKLILLLVDMFEAMDQPDADLIDDVAKELIDICPVYLIDCDRKKVSRNYIHYYVCHWLHHKMHGTPYDVIEMKAEHKTFIFMNRMGRSHRVQMLSEILKNGLRKHGYISFTKEISCYSNWPGKYPEVFKAKFDILDFKNVGEKNPTQYVPLNYCEDSFLFLNTETYTGDDKMFLTEKTFKPIRLGMPFMTIANVGTLEYLKELGFKTFGDWFDESYDTEVDLDKRIAIVINELKRINKIGHYERFMMRDEMKPILEHNKRLIEEKTYGKADIENVLIDIYEKNRLE